jgi:hypothetical protein
MYIYIYIYIYICNYWLPKLNSLFSVPMLPTNLWRLPKIANSDYDLRHGCLSIGPSRSHRIARLTLEGFSWNLVLEYFSKINWGYSGFMKNFHKTKSLSDLPLSEIVMVVLSDMSVYATVIKYFSDMQLRLSSLNLSLCRPRIYNFIVNFVWVYWYFNNILCQEEMCTANVSSCRFMFLDLLTLKMET